MTNTPTTANAGTRSMSLNVTAVTAFAVLDAEADEREWLEEDERDDDDDDDDPDVEGLTDDAFELRLVASGIMDIKMGAIVPGVVGVGVGTLAGGNGHQKSYVDDVVGMFVTGFCRRNGPCISWSANRRMAEPYAVVGIGITTLAGGDGCRQS